MFDFYISDNIPDEVISAIASKLFNVPLDQILIVKQTDDWNSVTQDTTIVIEIFKRTGDFHLKISIVSFDDALIDVYGERELARLLALKLGCYVAISGDEYTKHFNPYIWVRFSNQGILQRFLIDSESPDGVIIIIKVYD